MATATAFLFERGAKDFQVFRGDPPTDAQHNTIVLSQESVDPARHGGVALLCALPRNEQTKRHSRSTDNAPETPGERRSRSW